MSWSGGCDAEWLGREANHGEGRRDGRGLVCHAHSWGVSWSGGHGSRGSEGVYELRGVSWSRGWMRVFREWSGGHGQIVSWGEAVAGERVPLSGGMMKACLLGGKSCGGRGARLNYRWWDKGGSR